MPVLGNSSRMIRAASRPSVVPVGGIRMSTTTRSGLSALTCASSSGLLPARPTTSKPHRTSRPHNPSRSSTSSSATTTRKARSADSLPLSPVLALFAFMTVPSTSPLTTCALNRLSLAHIGAFRRPVICERDAASCHRRRNEGEHLICACHRLTPGGTGAGRLLDGGEPPDLRADGQSEPQLCPVERGDVALAQWKRNAQVEPVERSADDVIRLVEKQVPKVGLGAAVGVLLRQIPHRHQQKREGEGSLHEALLGRGEASGTSWTFCALMTRRGEHHGQQHRHHSIRCAEHGSAFLVGCSSVAARAWVN